jgi:hypothetical protein
MRAVYTDNRFQLLVGEPVPPGTVTPEGLQQTVSALRGDWR